MTTNQNDGTEVLIFIIGVVAILGLIITFTLYSDSGKGTGVENIEYNQSDNESEERVSLISADNGNAVVEGTILGDTQGTVVVDDITRKGDNVEATVSVRSDDVSDTFVPYKYKMELSGVKKDDNLRIRHENRENKEVVYDETIHTNTESSIELINTSSSRTTNNYEYEIGSDKIKIEGNIVGSTSGQTPVIEGYEVRDDVLHVEIGLESSEGIAATVVTGYKYRAEVSGTQVSEVQVSHNGVEDIKSNSKNSETNLDLENKGTDGEAKDSARIRWSDNGASLSGSIVGNSGGQEVFINNSYEEQNTYVVELDTELKNEDGIATTVVLSYGYELDIEGDNVPDRIRVEHVGGETYKFERNNTGSGEDFDYKFQNEGSSNQKGELVERNDEFFIIEGSFITGSSTCTKASLENIERSDDVLDVKLAPKSNSPLFGFCTDDLGPSPYRLRVDYEGEINRVNLDIEQKNMQNEELSIEL